MLRKFLLALILGIFLAAIKVNAIAAEESVPAKEAPEAEEEWYPPSAGPVTTWTAPMCAKGQFLIQPFFFYNRTRGTFDAEGKYRSLNKGDRKYQYQEELFMEYGVTDRLAVSADIFYQENYVREDGASAHSSGFADSYLYLRYCMLEEKKWLPQVTGLLQVKMPMGKYQHLNPDKLGADAMGTGSWDPAFGAIITKRIKPFIFHADAVFSFPQKVMIDKAKTRYAPYANYDFGVEYFLPKGFNLLLEANGYLQGDTWSDGGRTPGTSTQYLNICPGIGWSNDKIQTLIAYQRTLVGKNMDANDSVILTCVYTF
ncbi:MAG: transporter [Candidatus Omnitrophica bacterium]|nr:transporter [Candidatus Omnitrophota bacterium]